MSPTVVDNDAPSPGQSGFWFVVFGVLQIVIGLFALAYSVIVTEVSVMLFGWLMIVGGIFEIGHAIWDRGWEGFFIDLLAGLLSLVVGFMIVIHPLAAALTLTILIAVFLIFGGLFRIVVAFAIPTRHWFWILANGIISFLLGLAILQDWPVSGLWVIGLFVGISMVLHGLGKVMLGLSARSIPPGPGSTQPNIDA